MHVKDETTRLGGRAFHALGVSYALTKLMERAELKAGDTVAAASIDGALGEALAVAARQRGLTCVVLVPRGGVGGVGGGSGGRLGGVCADRLAVIRGLGAQVRRVDGTYADCVARLRREAASEGWVPVCDCGWDGNTQVPLDMMHGYTQVFREALEQMPEPPTHVIVPAEGGGGLLLAAAAAHLSVHSPRTQLIAVEPIDAASVLENAKANRPADRLERCEGGAGSLMEGLNGRVPSAVTWPLIASHCSDYVAIGDAWAKKATRTLYHSHGLSASASGAAAHAGLLAALSLEGSLGIEASSRVLIVATEGVGNPDAFNAICGEDACTLTPDEVLASISKRCALIVGPPSASNMLHMQSMPPRGVLVREEAVAARKKGFLAHVSSLFPSTESLKSNRSLFSSTDNLESIASLSSDDEDEIIPAPAAVRPVPAAAAAAPPAQASAAPALVADVDAKPKPTRQVWTINLK